MADLPHDLDLGVDVTVFNSIYKEMNEADDSKKELAKKHSKHKAKIKRVLKRKLEEIQETNPETESVSIMMGDTPVRVFEEEKCKNPSAEDLFPHVADEHMDILHQAIAAYVDNNTKKRIKIHIGE